MSDELTKRTLQEIVQRKPQVIVLALALALVIGVLDYATGRELIVSPFYLVPICWLTWNVGRKAGLLLSAVCAVIWLVAELAARYSYPHPAIPFWNSFMLLVIYAVVAWLLGALHNANDRLEETVQRRTAALQVEIAERKRIEIAKIQGERLAAIGTMAAGVAHEVRNPLGSIVLNLDLIHKEVEQLAGTSQHSPEEGRLLVNEMRVEIRRIQQVLEDYLQFARMSKPERRSLGLNDFLDEKLAFMHSEFAQAGVELRTAFDPSLKTVEADGEQLWQATLNLLRNSLEAMPDGGELAVNTQRDDTHVMVQVCDSGQGMTAEQLKQVFAPFFTTKKAGTGLGLALVQQIVTEHGGHVECESAHGKGSTFTIYLPFTRQS